MLPTMTKEEHIQRHELLQDHLVEIIGDYIAHTKKLPSTVSILELMKWAAKQCIEPT